MNAKALEAYLHSKIPLSRAMRVRVVELLEDRIVLCAPLRPNRNHQHTAFGGSIATIGLLAGWALLHARLEQNCIPHNLVVQRQDVEYRRPIAGPLRATAALTSHAEWQRFLRSLKRHKKGSISVVALLEHEGQPAAQIRGKFVALAPDK